MSRQTSNASGPMAYTIVLFVSFLALSHRYLKKKHNICQKRPFSSIHTKLSFKRYENEQAVEREEERKNDDNDIIKQ